MTNSRPKGEWLGTYLPKEEFRRVADVRRQIWTGGFSGLALGGLGGVSGYYVARYFRLFGMAKTKPGLMGGALFMGGSALGGFTGALSAGLQAKEDHNLVETFRHNQTAPAERGTTRYQQIRAAAQAEQEQRELAVSGGGGSAEAGASAFYAERRRTVNGRYEKGS